MQSIPVFLDIAKFANFRWKMLMSAERKRQVTWFKYFLHILEVRHNCAMFHHCRICVIDFRGGGGDLWAALKRPILNRVIWMMPYGRDSRSNLLNLELPSLWNTMVWKLSLVFFKTLQDVFSVELPASI